MDSPDASLTSVPVGPTVHLARGPLSVPSADRATLAIYRAAVLIVAAWSLLATTLLVWFLAEGGVDAVASLVRSPSVLFSSRAVSAWEAGAVGAFCLFAVAFAICQVVGRGLLHLLGPRAVPWPDGLARPEFPVRLLAFRSARADAFTFTLLVRSRGLRWARQEVILVSSALLDVLEPLEWQAVVAHELGHVRAYDGRYLTFLRTFARLMRWDPILAAVASRLTRREEFRADREAVDQTRRPRALARAIFKAASLAGPAPHGIGGLLGPGGRAGRRQAFERIRWLVALAESGGFEEEGGA
jgi:Zn-dependent protease with chaperone function